MGSYERVLGEKAVLLVLFRKVRFTFARLRCEQILYEIVQYQRYEYN